MKVPTSIKAFGRVYKIERENDITEKMEVWGYVDSCRDVVVLRKRDEEFTIGHERQVLLHEILHVINNNLHVGLGEDQVQLISVGLVTIMHDNGLDFSCEK
jgi:hypothetical protein